MPFTGEIAAVATAVCWACAAAFFVSAGRRMGSMQLNRLRLVVAALCLTATLWIVRGAPWPHDATQSQLFFLAASGIAGFAIGDSFYFRALVILGAGRTALLLALAPIFTLLFARFWIGETVGPRALLGIAMTLGGLMLVLHARGDGAPHHPEGSPRVGVACGILAAVAAAAGYVLSTIALRTGIDALSATLIRVVAALAALWLAVLPRNGFASARTALADRFAGRMMVAGAICGPFLGVTLSLYALQHTQAAIATSIFACSPLFAIVLGARFHREPLTPRIAAGALLTVAGVVMLFTRH
jgi:drug/metabolite transporter (DMT)-like permease